MNSSLTDFLKLNNINMDVLYDALHKDILESILSKICEYMKANDSADETMRNIYFRNSNDIDAAKQIVRHVCQLSLAEQDYLWLNDCIKAHMKKKPRRKQLPDSLRQELWKKQKQKCYICGRVLLSEEGHIDHIVPWDYVGDELDNNYQLLCSDCNYHKSNHVALAVHSLIFKTIR